MRTAWALVTLSMLANPAAATPRRDIEGVATGMRIAEARKILSDRGARCVAKAGKLRCAFDTLTGIELVYVPDATPAVEDALVVAITCSFAIRQPESSEQLIVTTYSAARQADGTYRLPTGEILRIDMTRSAGRGFLKVADPALAAREAARSAARTGHAAAPIDID